MPPRAGDPLRKVTLNLFEDDCQVMETMHGQGWSTEVRSLVHNYCVMLKSPKTLRTLQDLVDSGALDEVEGNKDE